ncbi:hypothetical protein E4T50_13427 [Aureobasidium sp. EXF-12298]|nr:hypothetical protein E4T50_13427 [Aureobasidium sp. EXF-12298]
MAFNGLALPDSLRELFANVNLEDITKAITNVTLTDFNHLINVAKGRELNTDTVIKLYEEASKVHGAGSALMAAGLVISVISFCFPMAALSPISTALGFVGYGIAPTSLVAALQSVWGVNALFSLLQSAAMGGYGAPVVA